ncbi:MAG: hypothetical protein IPH07_04000 [Deltaproteobacteria bacterium]|nr:hypothetical protein [Deltaproteobacteria bacterium]MBP7289773.1 hypothetical protein [Nannocystaceae bacterium]
MSPRRSRSSSPRARPRFSPWACVVLATACTRAPGVLVSPEGEHRLSVHDDATGITVVLTTGVWDAEPKQLPNNVAVVHVLVANLGPQPILLAPGDLELRDTRGFRYALLDAGASFDAVDADVTASAQRYDRELERSYDPGRSMDFEPFAAGDDVPRLALPWGTLAPGTQMRGFLYFEPVTRTANEAVLRWHLGDPQHQPLFDAVFEFRVADG